MTKAVRIENADTSDHKVRVFVETKGADGKWERHQEPVPLDYPTEMYTGWIHAGQRLVIEEVASQ